MSLSVRPSRRVVARSITRSQSFAGVNSYDKSYRSVLTYTCTWPHERGINDKKPKHCSQACIRGGWCIKYSCYIDDYVYFSNSASEFNELFIGPINILKTMSRRSILVLCLASMRVLWLMIIVSMIYTMIYRVT